MTASRLDLRKPPPAMAAVALLVVLATAVVLIVWTRLEAIRPSAECLQTWLLSGEGTGACATSIGPWQDRREEWLLAIIRLVPILAGLGLGAIVGSSVWRRRDGVADGWRPWLTRRVLPAVALLVGSLAVFAVVATAYQAARMPGLDPLGSFDEYGVTGISVITRGLAAFGVSVLAWVLIRRRIVALLVSVALAWLVLWGTTEAFPYGALTEWRTDAEASGSYLQGDIGLEVGWQDADGAVIPYGAVQELAPDAGWLDWAEMHYWQVQAYLSGDRFFEVQAREALLLGVVTLLGIAGAVLVVARRRSAVDPEVT
jgi:hypothetical protein